MATALFTPPAVVGATVGATFVGKALGDGLDDDVDGADGEEPVAGALTEAVDVARGVSFFAELRHQWITVTHATATSGTMMITAIYGHILLHAE